MARSKSSKKAKATNECRMKAEGVEGGNRRTPLDIGDPFKRKAPYFVEKMPATHPKSCYIVYFSARDVTFLIFFSVHILFVLNACHCCFFSIYRMGIQSVRCGVPWYHVEWRDLQGGNTWEPVKHLSWKDDVALVRCYEKARERQAAEHLRSKVRVAW